ANPSFTLWDVWMELPPTLHANVRERSAYVKLNNTASVLDNSWERGSLQNVGLL
ncbi:hypothetical protein KUCAC02_035949, partial [Chaenocephalus aceratus]